jgi:neutral amino acid transport system permease protein
MAQFLQLLANGLVTGSIIAIAAVGLSLVYGILKLVNFAHGEYLTFGAYAAFVVAVAWDGNMLVAAAAAVIATAALGIALEGVLWGPMRRHGAGIISLFITSIGVALVLRHAIFLGWGARPRRYPIDVFHAYQLGMIRLSLGQILVIAAALTALVGVGLLLAATKLGKTMRALSDDRDLAAVAGIDVQRVTVHTWILAAGLAGLAGVLQGVLQASFNPNMGFHLLLLIFAAVILGGVGSAYGALSAGLVLGVAMELSTWDALAGGLPGVYKPVVAFSLLILVLLFRPEGIFGKARVA